MVLESIRFRPEDPPGGSSREKPILALPVLAFPFLLAALPPAGGPASALASPPVEILFYAAASLRDALQRIAPECEKEAGVRLVFNFGASSDLARQIEAANKADLFFSADEAWMDYLARKGLVDGDSRKSFLSNRLVVVGPADGTLAVRGPADLAGSRFRRIALANPEAVPAGKYARAWLEKAGRWEAVRDRIVPAADVRAALAAVESGAVEAGVVYRTDAALSRKVRVLYEVPEGEGPRISYALAALRDRPEREKARLVAECVSSGKAGAVFQSLGFVMTGATP